MGDHVAPTAERHTAAVPNEAVAPDLIVVSSHEDCLLVVAGEQVPLDQVAVAFEGFHADVGVVPERVVQDPDVMRIAQDEPDPAVAVQRAISRTVPDDAPDLGEDSDADELVAGRSNSEHAVVSRPPAQGAEQHPLAEVAHGAVPHGDAAVAVVEQPEVVGLLSGVAADSGGTRVAVDQVAVQIEGDVVCPDHDPVVRAVDEIAVERRVGRDRVAAADVARRRLTCAEREPAARQEDHHEGERLTPGGRLVYVPHDTPLVGIPSAGARAHPRPRHTPGQQKWGQPQSPPRASTGLWRERGATGGAWRLLVPFDGYSRNRRSL